MQTSVISPEVLLKHWQGHRSLTRKVIASFPEDRLFEYSVGGMRPFSALALEMLEMAVPGMNGIVTGKWELPDGKSKAPAPRTREELLRLWDDATEHITRTGQKFLRRGFRRLTLPSDNGKVPSTGIFFILLTMKFTIEVRDMFTCVPLESSRHHSGIADKLVRPEFLIDSGRTIRFRIQKISV